MAIDPADVILVPLPFGDMAGEKASPAVVVSGSTYNSSGDLVVAAITSHPARFATDYELADWKTEDRRIETAVHGPDVSGHYGRFSGIAPCRPAQFKRLGPSSATPESGFCVSQLP
jgi:hypothetical protein